jgi:hypothetical protein
LFEEKSRIATRLKELKDEIKTYANLAKLGSARWRTIPTELVIKGRSFLRIKDNTMINALAKALGFTATH